MKILPFTVTWSIPNPPPVGVKVLVSMDGTLNTLRLATYAKVGGTYRWVYDGNYESSAPAFYLENLISANEQPMLERLKASEMWQYVCTQEDQFYFRVDTDDNTVKENEEYYYDICERLEQLGWKLEETCIEHDCISGTLIPME